MISIQWCSIVIDLDVVYQCLSSSHVVRYCQLAIAFLLAYTNGEHITGHEEHWMGENGNSLTRKLSNLKHQ